MAAKLPFSWGRNFCGETNDFQDDKDRLRTRPPHTVRTVTTGRNGRASNGDRGKDRLMEFDLQFTLRPLKTQITRLGWCMNEETPDSGDQGNTDPETTCWSAVLAAAGQSPESEQALELLCQRYWFPLFAFVRRTVGNAEEAQDITQEYFATLLEKNYIADADPQRGRFRTFLFTSMKNFMSKQWEKRRAIKRGGGTRTFSIDFRAAESRYLNMPVDAETPESLFLKNWVHELTRNTLQLMFNEQVSAGHNEKFKILKPFLVSSFENESLTEASEKLGMSVASTRVAVHRLRRRYGELIRGQIAETVENPDEIEEEINELFKSLGN